MVVVCICSSMFPMLNFERSGTETTGPVFGVGFCACSMFALPITMLSSAITRRVCFIVVFSWEGAHSPPSLIQTPPAALSFRQTLAREHAFKAHRRHAQTGQEIDSQARGLMHSFCSENGALMRERQERGINKGASSSGSRLRSCIPILLRLHQDDLRW